MNSSKTLVSILAATVMIAGLAACQKKEEVAGPAETVGQKIDQAAATAEQKIDKAAATAEQKIDEATAKISQEADKAKADASQSAANMQDATGKKLEEAGQKMQDASK